MKKNYNDIIAKIKKNYNDLIIYEDHAECDKNSSAIAGNEIFMGIYDDEDIKIIALFHELGHYLTHKVFSIQTMSTISCESFAWEIGFYIAKQYELEYEYYSKEKKWARQQLLTYINEVNISELK